MLEKIDYKKINFKAGLEIHQQLDSHKLFCSCPSVLRKDEPNFEIKRKLHAVAGESGEVDVAAQYQAKLNKEFIYQGYDSTCLVELDEDPPHEINGDALKIALQIAILMNCNIIPITQVMRKTVIDGSNTSGFQRTVMIAYGGYIETSRGQVGINAIMLEEDAARIIERGEKKEIYRLDRLGIPLVEVVTAPDIKDGVHAQETALIIGDILRSCRVKRGLGTIRQDISISIKGGNRVELKGVQDIDLLPTTVENEVRRQLELEKNKTPVCQKLEILLSTEKPNFCVQCWLFKNVS
jgi:glutamyl-tRNA(Gln) amidotransferase subunit E